MTSNTSSRSLILAGLQRARKEILLFTALVLGGCGTTIPSPTVSEIHHAPLAAVLADEHISNEEWRNEIGPSAAVLPLRASPFARTLLSVLANTEVGLPQISKRQQKNLGYVRTTALSGFPWPYTFRNDN